MVPLSVNVFFSVIYHFRISDSLHDLLAFDFLFAISAFSDKINDERYN